MVPSRETLQDLAAERQLQPATLERVIRLIDILDAFGADTLMERRHGTQRLPFRSGPPLGRYRCQLCRRGRKGADGRGPPGPGGLPQASRTSATGSFGRAKRPQRLTGTCRPWGQFCGRHHASGARSRKCLRSLYSSYATSATGGLAKPRKNASSKRRHRISATC
jgi:hypothetical protein